MTGKQNSKNKLYFSSSVLFCVLLVFGVQGFSVLANQRESSDLKGANREVTVAVIDTGIDYQHPKLRDFMWTNAGEIPDDGIDNDGNGYVDDYYGWDFYNEDNTVCHYDTTRYNPETEGYLEDPADSDNHGTHCAGIITSVANDTKIKLMSLKVTNGSENRGRVSDVIKAIRYAEQMGADICNISWYYDTPSESLETLMRDSKMLFIVAAGNRGEDNDSKPIYPASYAIPNKITVAYTDAKGQLNQKANYGLQTVDISAPGTSIYSTIVGSYFSMSGSSMATPHVTGLAALLYTYLEEPNPQIVKQLILENYKPVPSSKGKLKYPGIPNAEKIFQAAQQVSLDQTPPKLSIQTSYDQEEIVLSIEAEQQEELQTLRYFIGKRNISDFEQGKNGLPVYGKELRLLKSGIYTFYARDYSGNEVVIPYTVKDDTTSPTIKVKKTILSIDRISIELTCKDKGSGIKQVKYAKGILEDKDFASAKSGKEVVIYKGKAILEFKRKGTYTFYAVDYRGNKIVKTVPMN